MTTTATRTKPKINALAQWFGSNRAHAPAVGKLLGKLKWCGVPFCGGCPELPYIDCRTGVAVDQHRHLINLARVIADEEKKVELVRALEKKLFHTDELFQAQTRCREREATGEGQRLLTRGDFDCDVEWATDYFLCNWLARGGHAGRKWEFGQGLAIRFSTTGGDSAKRFRSAIESLDHWHNVLKSWTFACDDAFNVLRRVKDEPGHGLYIDAPWPGRGREYRHTFGDDQQRHLAAVLAHFQHLRIVVRYGEHPLIRELYPESDWTWHPQTTRNQANNEVSEFLIVKRCDNAMV